MFDSVWYVFVKSKKYGSPCEVISTIITRIVIFQVLDSVHMLFGDQHSPFITILAVDPHVIIKGIEHNLHGLFRDSSINGHDYLRNIVHLPFFLQPSYRPVKTRKDSVGSDSAANHASGSKFSVRGTKVNLFRDVIFPTHFDL